MKKSSESQQSTNVSSKILEQDLKEAEKILDGLCSDYDVISATKVTIAIKKGRQLLKIKRLRSKLRKRKKVKRKWIKYLKSRYPHIQKRKAQRDMRLAIHINLSQYPDLQYITLEKLERLISVIPGKDTGKQLIDKFNFSDLHYATNNNTAESIAGFKREIDDVLANFPKHWQEVELEEAYNSPQKKEINKQMKSVRDRLRREHKLRGEYDFNQLQKSANRSLDRLNDIFGVFLSERDKIVNCKKKDKIQIWFNKDNLKTFLNRFKLLEQAKLLTFDDSCDSFIDEYQDILEKLFGHGNKDLFVLPEDFEDAI